MNVVVWKRKNCHGEYEYQVENGWNLMKIGTKDLTE